MKLTAILAAVAVTALSVFGQSAPDRGQVELTRKAIQDRRQEIITQAMSFTDAEGKSFWPLFRDWREKNAGLGDRRLELINKVQDSSRLSDAETRALVDSWLKVEGDSLKLKNEYVKKFRKILPEKKLARFFQLENKLDAIVNYDLAGSVALAE